MNWQMGTGNWELGRRFAGAVLFVLAASASAQTGEVVVASRHRRFWSRSSSVNEPQNC